MVGILRKSDKIPRLEVIVVNKSVIMVVGKEAIRTPDLHELRCLENLRGVSLKSRMDGENYVRYSDLIVI